MPDNPLVRLAHVAEDLTAADRVVALMRPVADVVLGDPTRRRLLQGEPLGHAAHPLLTDLPIGFWASASVLDLLAPRSSRKAADRLVGLGILAAAPTALTGLADWSLGDRRVQRVGAVHAVLNVTALALYATSWTLRRSGARTAGVVTALVGAGVLGASGYLGGHMSFALKSPPPEAADPDARTAATAPAV
ncbi:DUF2231 domain-containing protein [Cellulomonas sp.]|uniref:DUF2231 domain-containing protein n=1 Tax=Cellulomonas sp. TaxID=40001 RepID=UPI001B0B7113|nr:DUF2231 domain-containing protein [Cellulomonas sp.]MBO9553455.1 DUF2231 domain-containing protein [Cellulomonas sp.]